MAVPSAITDLSTTAASNSPAGSDAIGTSLDDYLRAGYAFTRQLFNTGTIYSATVGGTANAVTLTPAPPITALLAGQSFRFIVGTSNTATATVAVSGLTATAIKKSIDGALVALVANDMVAATTADLLYDGTQFVLLNPHTNSHGADVASVAGTVVLNAVTGNIVDITGTEVITAITLAEGRSIRVRAAGAFTLTHGANLVCPTSANIVCAAGDQFDVVGYASGVVRIFNYQRLTGNPVSFVLAASTYTPSLTNGTNVAAATALTCQYMRVGDVVTVSGGVNLDPTSTGATELGISLPIASNLGAVTHLGGTAATVIAASENPGVIFADATNDRASLNTIAANTSNATWYFQFMYRVI